jgi:catechol 2,3-dioxygenase-like lactoylglutathione lyase family enzyme
MGPVVVSADDPRVADQLHDVFGAQAVSFRQSHLLSRDGVAVELFEFREPHMTQGKTAFDFWRCGQWHLCLVEPRIDELAERIEEHGGRRRTATRPVFPDAPFLFCYCEDPFGNIIEIATHPHAEAFGGRSGY